jgi:hypothetical protein
MSTFECDTGKGGDGRDERSAARRRPDSGRTFGLYQRDTADVFRPASLHVLVLDKGLIAEIHSFLVTGDRLFSIFGLPPVG